MEQSFITASLVAQTGDLRDTGSISGFGRFPGEGHGYPLQYSCLEISTDRGAWWATVPGAAKSWTQLSNEYFHFFFSHNIGVAVKVFCKCN